MKKSADRGIGRWISSASLALALVVYGPACGYGSAEVTQEELGSTGQGLHGGDPITTWSVRTSEHGAAASTHPLRVVIVLAIVHIAMYDAVNAIVGGYQEYGSKPAAAPGASPHAAAIRAAYTVLANEYPSRESILASQYDSDLAALEDSGQSKADGIAVGEAAAQAMIALRADDGRNASVSYTPPTGPGYWKPTPPGFLPAALPALALVTPFTMSSPSQFRPAGPPPLSSAKWAREYNEIKALGCDACPARTQEQTDTALFWSAPSNVILPPSIRDTSALYNLGLADAARMQAMAFTAQADALISSWDSKFNFHFWRPVTAIREGDTDGNDATEADPSWTPLLVTPNPPEYTGAHPHISSAVISAMAEFFGREKFDFVVRNPNTSVTRYYTRAIEAELEVSNARIWSGLHYRTSCDHGRKAGRAIAKQLGASYFTPEDDGD